MDFTLTIQDNLKLQQFQLGRLFEIIPRLSNFLVIFVQGTLCLNTPDNAIAHSILDEVDEILEAASVIMGASKLEVWDGSRMIHKSDLHFKSVYQAADDMTVITSNQDVEFNLQSAQLHKNETRSWQDIAAQTGEKEADIKRRSGELNISFYWVGDSWGVSLDDAKHLIFSFYSGKAQVAASKLEVANTSGVSNGTHSQIEVVTEKPVKPKPDKQPIKFVKEFKPVKKLALTVERYLDALAPENLDEQMAVMVEIVSDTGEGKRHLSKLLGSYSIEAEKPTRFDLQSAFKNLYNRRKSEVKKPDEAMIVQSEQEEDVALSET